MSDTFETIQDAAAALYAALETGARADGATYFFLKSSSPDWTINAARAAHGDMFPDDYKYSVIHDAAEWLSDENNDPDDTDEFSNDVDVYSSDLLKWLSSHRSRVAMVEEAIGELGWPGSIDQACMMGQVAERRDIIESLVNSLEAIVE